jgi:hypothetical protein
MKKRSIYVICEHFDSLQRRRRVSDYFEIACNTCNPGAGKVPCASNLSSEYASDTGNACKRDLPDPQGFTESWDENLVAFSLEGVCKSRQLVFLSVHKGDFFDFQVGFLQKPEHFILVGMG